MLVVGHRGAAGEAPENTIAGCRHAIERGVRHIEIDIQLSKDNKLVVVHDGTLKRTTGKSGRINSRTARQLATMDARQFGPPWPRKTDCGIPTLEQLLRRTPKLQSYQLEVKSGPRKDMQYIAEQLATMFPNKSAAKRIIVTSFNTHLLETLRSIAPHIRIGLVSYETNVGMVADALKPDYLCLHTELALAQSSVSLIRRMRRHGVHISVWTANEPDMIRALYKLNVDSVITDYPSMAIPLVACLQR